MPLAYTGCFGWLPMGMRRSAQSMQLSCTGECSDGGSSSDDGGCFTPQGLASPMARVYDRDGVLRVTTTAVCRGGSCQGGVRWFGKACGDECMQPAPNTNEALRLCFGGAA